jgi:membrane-associated protease RseP (regulator of RpoE activity)
MRRTLRFTGCVATATLGLVLANSAGRADEPPAEEQSPTIQEAAEAAAEAAQEAAQEAAEAAQEAAEAAVEQATRTAEEVAAKVAEEAHRTAESTARQAADAARTIAEKARYQAAKWDYPSGYHLGLQITVVPRALDAQLKLDGKGVLVDGVTKQGPADKAGIQANDLLLSVDGEPVASAKDLHKVMQTSEGKEIKITLLRGGEEQEVSVTPHKLETSGSFNLKLDKLAPKKEEVDAEIRKLEEKIREKLKGAGLDVRMQVLRPGHMLTIDDKLFINTRVPDDLEIQIVKKGETPAKIEIKQGEKSWSVTEDTLDELPDEVRPYAERMLIGGPAPFTIAVPAKPARPVRPARPAVSITTPDGKRVTGESIEITAETPQTRERHRGNLEHRIEDLSSEIERVSKKMDNLQRELKAQSERGKD